MEIDLAKPLGSGLRIGDFTQRIDFEGRRTYAFFAVDGGIGPVVDAWEAGWRNRVRGVQLALLSFTNSPVCPRARAFSHSRLRKLMM
ncbi:hypothetical protein NL676_039046 [Syzygium grande]|nr:hypothetical protein NL676_039046 [Syzygium grande]